MGVKSTVELTRQEAVWRYVKLRSKSFERIFHAEAALLSDTELENVLEVTNDAQSGGEGFENYSIVGGGEA